MHKADGIVFIKKDSERFPGKNFRTFNGAPLFTTILQTLERHPWIENMLVDSDSPEVLDYVKHYIRKGIAINRPETLWGGHISAN